MHIEYRKPVIEFEIFKFKVRVLQGWDKMDEACWDRVIYASDDGRLVKALY